MRRDFISFGIYLQNSLYSSIVNQISDLSVRIDHLELNLKKDIGTILDILHQQQQMQFQQFQQQSGKQMTAIYQPSESDFSFDLAAAAPGGPVDMRHGSAQHRTNVQRSISQPECANEGDKSLLK